MNKQEYKKMDVEALDILQAAKATLTLSNDLQNGNKQFKDWLAKNFLEKFFAKLHAYKFYQEICRISEFFSEEQLIINPQVLFYVASSFAEINNADKAMNCYWLYLNEIGDSAAVFNNLALIYEQRKEFESAEGLFQEAKRLNPHDEIIDRNCNRISEVLAEIEREKKKMQKAFELFKNDNPYVRGKILTFSTHKGKNGLVECTYKELPKLLNVSAQRALDLIHSFMDKQYVQKIDTGGSSAYRINPYIEQNLSAMQKELEEETELLRICEKLNVKFLEEIGYNEILEKQLETIISNSDLKELLKRDLKENALAVVTESYKSALVLSGSIIEAILLDRLSSTGKKTFQIVKTSKIVNKNLEELDLNELLDAAKNNNLIDASLSHLSHGVRGFRNLIHPGVEKRKASMKISKENVMLAWGIVKKILYEIK